MDFNQRKSIENGMIATGLVGIALLVIFSLPSYDHSVSGDYHGPDFEISLSVGLKMGNYYRTDMEGYYGDLSISEPLPYYEACFSRASIKRDNGSLEYGDIQESAMAFLGKIEADKCTKNILRYLDEEFAPKLATLESF